MKVGELRRFKDDLQSAARTRRRGAARCSGRPFMLLEVVGDAEWVSFLIDGRVEPGWGYTFVADNSTPLEPVQPAQEVVY